MQGWVHSYLQILTVQVAKEFSECIPFTSVTSNRFYGILNAKFNKKLKKKKKAGIGSENESTASIDPSVNKCQAQRQYGILIFKKKLPAGDHDAKRILKSHHHS